LKHIQILDDTFLLDNARVIQLCQLIIGADLGLTFGCIARVKPVSAEMFQWMEKAGFKTIEFGLETGSERLLRSIRKNITHQDVMDLIAALKPCDFAIHFLVMCGFPGEDEGTIQETVSFIQSVQKEKYARVTMVGKLEVFPGTEIYAGVKKAGWIDDGYWLTEKPVPFYTVEHDMKKLVEYEDFILDRVAIRRIFTVSGFFHQFLKLPVPILRHLSEHKEFIPHVISWPIKLYFPRLYGVARRIFKRSLLAQS
jgi:anaerobic magnesium-protoporphyrin IX monomethyl ester cyclase